MTLVGAYVCPRGVFATEFRRRTGALEVVRHFGVPARLGDAPAAAAQLVAALASMSIRGASVALAIRGFDVVHHVLPFPPARDDLLTALVERELRRVEPQLTDAVIAWSPLPRDAEDAEPNAPRQLLVSGAPRETAEAFQGALRDGGHRLAHLTVIAAAAQRLEEEMVESRDTTAFVSPLPDGAFLGFFLRGALRLVVEPPLPDGDDQPDGQAMVEEAELGAMFVRQQFRGAQLERVVMAHGGGAFADTEERLRERLGVPVQRLDVHGMPAASLIAMGAVLDAGAARPLALAGAAVGRQAPGARAYLRMASLASVILAGLLGAWALFAAISARQLAGSLRDVQRRVEQESFGAAPMRQTADQRRLIRDAVIAIRTAEADRVNLQNTLAALGAAVHRPVQLDSLDLERGTNGWIAEVGGSVRAGTNGLAVQAIHDFYRELPRRVAVEGLSLDQLSYVERVAGGVPEVRFRLTFELPEAKAP